MTDVLSTIVSQLVSPDTLSTLSTAAKDAFNLIQNELKSFKFPSGVSAAFPSNYTVVLPTTNDILGLINNNTLTPKQKANIIANHIVYNPTQCSLAGKKTLTAVSDACVSKKVQNNLVLPQRYELNPGCVVTDFTNVTNC